MANKKTMVELKQQRGQINARIQALENRVLAEEKKRDMRRKLLAGAYLLRLLKGDLIQLRKKLAEANMLSERDRRLFHEGETVTTNFEAKKNAAPVKMQRSNPTEPPLSDGRS